MSEAVSRLAREHTLNDNELLQLISGGFDDELITEADRLRSEIYGDEVFIRGLIEISAICRNDCYYCGIRASNGNAKRYRLTKEEIFDCCRRGTELGFSTFVLQGGEDGYFCDSLVCEIIDGIKKIAPGAAVTLSLGEKSREAYRKLYAAGADRYLLRHETADAAHYADLHPAKMSLESRKRCLFDLKEIGFQVGSGFMVGSPGQKPEHLLSDLRFLQKLEPDMIGIGPFIPHRDTPFAEYPPGSMELSLRMLAILRLMFPEALIPSTTALGTVAENGRELGLRAGANVVMPNLSPAEVRGKYNLYDNKLSVGAESAEGLKLLEEKIRSVGLQMSMRRGDSRTFEKEKGNKK